MKQHLLRHCAFPLQYKPFGCGFIAAALNKRNKLVLCFNINYEMNKFMFKTLVIILPEQNTPAMLTDSHTF